jgi:gliding motility-associated-like protein
LNFVIGQPDPLSAEFTTTAANCNANNGSVSIDADGGYPPYTYYWTNSGTTNTTYSNQSAGSGSMILEDANGCNTTLNYSIPEIPVAVSFVTNVIEGLSPLQVEFINTSTGGNTYTWDFGDGSDPVVTSSTSSIFHTYTEEGSYDATLTASYNGSCDQTTSVTILVFEVSEITTVPNIISPNNDNHNDTFRVVSLNIRNLEVLIFDRWGRQVGELKSPTDEWNARDQSAGTYYYILRAEGYDGIKYEQEGHLTVVR